MGAQFPDIIGGNQQGFVMIKDKGVHEGISQYISAITVSGGTVTITSPNHCLDSGDYLQITGVIGGTATLNGTIVQILQIVDANNFNIDGPVPSGSYLGGGVYARLSNFNILSKQFPVFWTQDRKARIGTQRFLMDNSQTGQITVSIYGSQNSDVPMNSKAINPYIIYTNAMNTGPEDPEDTYAVSQQQIWHRVSNSFIGDSVQIGFTLSDAQMRNPLMNSVETTIHIIAFDLYPGPILI